MVVKFYSLFVLLGISVLLLSLRIKNKNLTERSITLLVLLHIIVGIMISPRMVILLFCALLLLYSLFEFIQATRLHNLWLPAGLLIGVLFYSYEKNLNPELLAVLIGTYSAYGFMVLFLNNSYSKRLNGITSIFFIPIGLVFFTLCISENPALAISLIVLVQFSDIFAYLGGKLFGRRKVFPKISPSKTLEGFLFSIAGVGIALVVLKVYIGTLMESWLLVFSLFLPVFTIMTNAGDLVFSRIKRANNIKDFSNILPGHGGALDRIDNLIFCAPLVYLLFNYNQYV